ncbi:MAG: 1,6-anhydro-N-acetylmuramyl-L-alanine amidase AmpD [gamma proteobacterium symbiont of Taylorina sp.]|nr:1,6-anhydro-N-acetylmuramyl-L-alanine amidase AmpD [gamma proteobacterium symbiont of Taylorina sp.]
MYKILNGWFKQSRKLASPNYDLRPENTLIDAIIIHSISMPLACYEGDDISQLFTNQLDCDKAPSYAEVRGLKVSAHLLIRRTGELIQYVDLNLRAWHAGKSCLGHREKCNDFSIGIELEGTDQSVFETAQYDTLIEVVKALLIYFPHISKEHIVGHSDVAPGRKTDPGTGFDWDELFSRL